VRISHTPTAAASAIASAKHAIVQRRMRAEGLRAVARGDAAGFEIGVELRIEATTRATTASRSPPSLATSLRSPRSDRGHDDRAELSIVLVRELRDLRRELLVRFGLGDGLAGARSLRWCFDDLRVVAEVTGTELDQRVRLMDVLLAHIGRGHVAGVLRVIEPCDLGLGVADLAQRPELEDERGGEQHQHGAERREDAAPGGTAQRRSVGRHDLVMVIVVPGARMCAGFLGGLPRIGPGLDLREVVALDRARLVVGHGRLLAGDAENVALDAVARELVGGRPRSATSAGRVACTSRGRRCAEAVADLDLEREHAAHVDDAVRALAPPSIDLIELPGWVMRMAPSRPCRVLPMVM
jgi:hypothetical protein